MPTAKLILDDTTVELPVIVGTEGERAIDIRKLRAQTGYITYDPAWRTRAHARAASRSSTARPGCCATGDMPSRTWWSTRRSSR
nr:hypothetical protein [Rhodothermus marinus]